MPAHRRATQVDAAEPAVDAAALAHPVGLAGEEAPAQRRELVAGSRAHERRRRARWRALRAAGRPRRRPTGNVRHRGCAGRSPPAAARPPPLPPAPGARCAPGRRASTGTPRRSGAAPPPGTAAPPAAPPPAQRAPAGARRGNRATPLPPPRSCRMVTGRRRGSSSRSCAPSSCPSPWKGSTPGKASIWMRLSRAPPVPCCANQSSSCSELQLIVEVVLEPQHHLLVLAAARERRVAPGERRAQLGVGAPAEGRQRAGAHLRQLLERRRHRHRAVVQHVTPGELLAADAAGAETGEHRVAVGDVQHRSAPARPPPPRPPSAAVPGPRRAAPAGGRHRPPPAAAGSAGTPDRAPPWRSARTCCAASAGGAGARTWRTARGVSPARRARRDRAAARLSPAGRAAPASVPRCRTSWHLVDLRVRQRLVDSQLAALEPLDGGGGADDDQLVAALQPRVGGGASTARGGLPGRGRLISMTRTPKRCGRCASASVGRASGGGTGTSRSAKSGGSST